MDKRHIIAICTAIHKLNLDNFIFIKWEEKMPFGTFLFDPDLTRKDNIYYDSRINRFVQLRRKFGDQLVFSEPTEFYHDAMTTVAEQYKSKNYLDVLEKVGDIEKFEKAEKDEIINKWRVKKELEPPA